MNMIRKASAIILSLMVVFFTVLSILAIWDIIQVEDIFKKSISTLFVLFVAAAIMLFLFAVVFKGDENAPRPPKNPPMG